MSDLCIGKWTAETFRRTTATARRFTQAGFYALLSNYKFGRIGEGMKSKIAVGALVYCFLLVAPGFGAGQRHDFGVAIGTPLEKVAQIGMKSQIENMFVTSVMLIGFLCLAYWLDPLSHRIKKWLRK